MELVRTAEDQVTRFALVRAIRGTTHKTLGHQLGVPATDVLAWERGKEKPSPAQVKRLGLALRWDWADLVQPPLPHDEAWSELLAARKAACSEAV